MLFVLRRFTIVDQVAAANRKLGGRRIDLVDHRLHVFGLLILALPPQVRADRPFIVVIRERLTGTILFMGKIVRMP